MSLSLIQILRQWSKFNYLLKCCFPQQKSLDEVEQAELSLEALLDGTCPPIPSISISPIGTPPSFIVMFPVHKKQHQVRISVVENGDIDVDVAEHLKERTSGLIEGAGIGVGMEFLRNELVQLQ